MSWGLRAAIKVPLEQRKGEWCTAAWIAARVATSLEQVLFDCEELVLLGEIRFDMRAGQAVFGVEVLDEFPRVNDIHGAIGSLS